MMIIRTNVHFIAPLVPFLEK